MGCCLSNTYIVVAAPAHMDTRLGDNFLAFCPPIKSLTYFWSFASFFQQPIKTASRTELSRVARFVKPACAVRNEDSKTKFFVFACGK